MALLLFVGFVALGVAVVVLAQRSGADFAAGMLSRYLGRHVDIGSLSLEPGQALAIELHDVFIFAEGEPSGEPVLELPRARATQSWPRLLVGQLLPSKWEIDGLALLVSAPAGKGGAPALPELPPLDLVVRDASVTFERPTGAPLRLVELSLETTRSRLRARVFGQARGRVLVGDAPLASFSAGVEGWGNELALAGELEDLDLAVLPGTEAAAWSGLATGSVDLRTAGERVDAHLELSVAGLSIDPPRFREPIAPMETELVADCRWDGELLTVRTDPLRLDDFALRGELELSTGQGGRVSGAFDIADFEPGVPTLGRLHPISFLGLRHKTWADVDLRTEAGSFRDVVLSFDMALEDLQDVIGFRRPLAPEELRIAGRLDGALFRPSPTSRPLEEMSAAFAITGNTFELRELRMNQGGQPLPEINLTIDGMHRLVRLPRAERKRPRGPGTSISGLFAAVRALRGPGKSGRAPLVVDFDELQIGHPAFLVPIRDARGQARFPSGRMVIEEASAVVGGVPGALSVDFDGKRLDAVLRYSEAQAPPPRDPGESWASAAIAMDPVWIGNWRMDALKTQLRVQGARLQFLDVDAHFAGGPFVGDGEIDLGDPGGADWWFRGSLAEADASGLTQPLGRPDGSIQGVLYVDGVFRGRLQAGADFLTHADLGLAVRIERGSLGALPALVKLARLPSLQGVRGLFGAQLPIDTASADIAIRGGVLRSQNLAVEGPELRVLARGQVDLAREPHDSEFVFAFLFLETVDKVIGNVPILGRLVLGPDRSLITLYIKSDGPWEDPNLRPLLPGAVETAAGWATRAIEGAVGRLRRIFRPPSTPPESGLGHDARAR